MKTLLLACAAAVLLAGCGGTVRIAGAGVSTPAAAAGPTVAVGSPITVLTVNGGRATVTVLSVNYHAGPRNSYAPASENGRFAVADVSVEVSTGAYSYGAPYFAYQSADRTVYRFTDGHGALAGYEPAMGFGTLAAGQSTRGLVTFDVPDGPGRAIELTGVLGALLGQWRLP